MGEVFQSHQDLASLSVCKTAELKTKTWEKQKENQWSPFPFNQQNTLSHQRLTLVKSDPIWVLSWDEYSWSKILMDLLDATGSIKSQNTDMSWREYSDRLF